jgi:hypothetical protein
MFILSEIFTFHKYFVGEQLCPFIKSSYINLTMKIPLVEPGEKPFLSNKKTVRVLLPATSSPQLKYCH